VILLPFPFITTGGAMQKARPVRERGQVNYFVSPSGYLFLLFFSYSLLRFFASSLLSSTGLWPLGMEGKKCSKMRKIAHNRRDLASFSLPLRSSKAFTAFEKRPGKDTKSSKFSIFVQKKLTTHSFLFKIKL
jgi:hypothetical protein